MSTLFQHFFEKFNQLSPLEHDFTSVLDAIALKPKMLYFYGKMPGNVTIDGVKQRAKAVAIVGARKNTPYGEEIAYKMAYDLAKRGVVIVSGLAFGIDSIAHRAALDAGGVTVAVLGTPINQIYPRQHESLAREIIEKGGAVISEYAPGTKVYPKTSFLERNRLIAGLSDVVVIAEAAERSGSLNTAMHALDQGKDLFAVPGNITSPMSQGCNKLIRQGANPYTSVDDILDLLFPAPKKRKNTQPQLLLADNEEELAILKALADGISDGEAIMQKTRLSAGVFNQTVTMLEIKGVIRALGANKWARR
jgi:DNA processing protein